MSGSLTDVDCATAVRDATRAAQAAHVRIVEPHEEEVGRRIVKTGELVWGPGGTFAPNELRALTFSGNPVYLALDEDEPDHPVVGFAVGFLGWSPLLHVHSHQVGVVAGQRRRGIGYALKLAQRSTCLTHGITDMRWTFDPLIRRNAAFNLNALGARAASFHPDFYGVMTDSINAGDATDRLEAVWDLRKPLPGRTAVGDRPCPAGRVLVDAKDGQPVRVERAPAAGDLIGVPADYETIRRSDAEAAWSWRVTMRLVLQEAYAAGLYIASVNDLGYRLQPLERST
jgi:predicted GNAT superfamily acetyltransferase